MNEEEIRANIERLNNADTTDGEPDPGRAPDEPGRIPLAITAVDSTVYALHMSTRNRLLSIWRRGPSGGKVGYCGVEDGIRSFWTICVNM